MMMTQPFPAHQGIPQHPGLPPGHPMAQAQHPNAAHMGVQGPGAGMVQQIHPGVSAAAGPQVSQPGPMMAGMPPGAGTTGPGGPVPNAHALSHLNPAQAQHLFQQQQFAQNCEFPRSPFFCLICFPSARARICPSSSMEREPVTCPLNGRPLKEPLVRVHDYYDGTLSFKLRTPTMPNPFATTRVFDIRLLSRF